MCSDTTAEPGGDGGATHSTVAQPRNPRARIAGWARAPAASDSLGPVTPGNQLVVLVEVPRLSSCGLRLGRRAEVTLVGSGPVAH